MACNKVPFFSRKKAKSAKKTYQRNFRKKYEEYFCSDCQNWHLTTVEMEEKITRRKYNRKKHYTHNKIAGVLKRLEVFGAKRLSDQKHVVHEYLKYEVKMQKIKMKKRNFKWEDALIYLSNNYKPFDQYLKSHEDTNN